MENQNISQAEIFLNKRKAELHAFLSKLNSNREREPVRISLQAVHPRFKENRSYSYIEGDSSDLRYISDQMKKAISERIEQINDIIEKLKS